MLTSRAGNAQAIGQRLQKKLPYGGRAERTRALKKTNLAMTVLLSLQRYQSLDLEERRNDSFFPLTTVLLCKNSSLLSSSWS